jgi:hypothetical protein
VLSVRNRGEFSEPDFNALKMSRQAPTGKHEGQLKWASDDASKLAEKAKPAVDGDLGWRYPVCELNSCIGPWEG